MRPEEFLLEVKRFLGKKLSPIPAFGVQVLVDESRLVKSAKVYLPLGVGLVFDKMGNIHLGSNLVFSRQEEIAGIPTSFRLVKIVNKGIHIIGLFREEE